MKHKTFMKLLIDVAMYIVYLILMFAAGVGGFFSRDRRNRHRHAVHHSYSSEPQHDKRTDRQRPSRLGWRPQKAAPCIRSDSFHRHAAGDPYGHPCYEGAVCAAHRSAMGADLPCAQVCFLWLPRGALSACADVMPALSESFRPWKRRSCARRSVASALARRFPWRSIWRLCCAFRATTELRLSFHPTLRSVPKLGERFVRKKR